MNFENEDVICWLISTMDKGVLLLLSDLLLEHRPEYYGYENIVLVE